MSIQVTTAAKTTASAIGTIAVAISAALADDVFNSDDAGVVTTIVVALLSIYAVWRTPNRVKNPAQIADEL